MSNYNKIMLDVLHSHSDAEKWGAAEFGKIRQLPNTKVGSVGEDFIELICAKYKFATVFPEDKLGKRSKQSPWDIRINGITFELKTASEDVKGKFQFNHFRYARSYDAAMVLGISPNDLYFNVWSKAELTTGKAGTLVSMEKSGSASYKLSKKRDDLYHMSEFETVMTKFLGGTDF